eukprot:1179102-Prorocentrum_minimum.AAC.3
MATCFLEGADLLETGALDAAGARALEADLRGKLGGEVPLPEGFVLAHPAVNKLAAYGMQQLLKTAVGTLTRPHTLLERYLEQQVTFETLALESYTIA